MRAIIAILVLVFLWPSLSFAQTKGNLLRGAKTLFVSMDLNPIDKGKCAIKREDIVSAYKFPFSNSNIVLSDKLAGSDLWLYINISSVESQVGERVKGCAFHIKFVVYSYIMDKIPFNKKQTPFLSYLYTSSSLQISNVSEFRSFIREEIEEKSKKFITAYNLDNK